MSRVEVLCTTMHQNDFSKLEKMNIQTDVVFTNQSNYTEYQEINSKNHKARMISTNTRGVGKNRNLALTYARGDICLLADDDITYVDGYENIICKAFNRLPDADLIIFNFNSNSEIRQIKKINKCKQMNMLMRNPYGALQIAVRLKSQKKLNVWFSTLFGGGCIYPCGEDSLFINAFREKGTVYLYPATIGNVDFTTSTWFTGFNPSYYFGKGAYCAAGHSKFLLIWQIYYAARTCNMSELSFIESFKWVRRGTAAYGKLISYKKWCDLNENI